MKLTMEKQIERLIELGKEYKKVGMEYGFGNNNRTYVINGYNPIMPKDGAAKVSLYFADNYETYAFQVGCFEWSEYSDKVEIKVSALRDLNELFFYAQSILQILKSEFGDATRKRVETEKAERINTLKSELKALEDESSNTEDDLEKRTHIVIILTKMCEMVGIKYEDIDFTDDNWFMRHSWSSTTQDIFKAWLVDYLYNSYAARREICMVNYKSFKHLSKVASYFIMMYGWKSHAL